MKIKGLSFKQSRFVKEIMDEGNTQGEAVKKAGYNVKNKASASSLARNILKSKKVQEAITDIVAKNHPELGENAALVLNMIVTGDFKCAKCHIPGSTATEKMKAIDMLGKFFGWAAPSKHLSAKVNVDDYRLPGDKK